MPLTFAEAEKWYREDKINDLTRNEAGFRFLLLRSLSRKAHLEKLVADVGLNLSGIPKAQWLRTIFDSNVTIPQLRGTIGAIHASERNDRTKDESALISELYKMESFDWGGLHQNALEKTIVDNYVKKIKSFDQLNKSIDNQLLTSMRGYVQCSWYNHWTSIIIEDIFKSHPNVLPSVGLIKKIDFFIYEIAFDLKVTHLPEGFLKEKRADKNLPSEISLLRREARDNGIKIEKALPESRQIDLLWRQLADLPKKNSGQLISDLSNVRREVVRSCVNDPEELIKWLYENQGVRRFDASNRLFMVLIDTNNYFESWKLKRAKSFLAKAIENYLDKAQRGAVGHSIKFNWGDDKHTAISDAIFLLR